MKATWLILWRCPSCCLNSSDSSEGVLLPSFPSAFLWHQFGPQGSEQIQTLSVFPAHNTQTICWQIVVRMSHGSISFIRRWAVTVKECVIVVDAEVCSPFRNLSDWGRSVCRVWWWWNTFCRMMGGWKAGWGVGAVLHKDSSFGQLLQCCLSIGKRRMRTFLLCFSIQTMLYLWANNTVHMIVCQCKPKCIVWGCLLNLVLFEWSPVINFSWPPSSDVV